MEGESYHKSCFKCAHGGCPLTHATYAALDGVLYCKHHFTQLFMEKGNYQHVLKAAHKKNQVAPVDSDESEGEETRAAAASEAEPEEEDHENDKAEE